MIAQKCIPNNILLQQWKTGPISDQSLEPGHGRGIFCMSIKGDSLVTGSADHGLREYNLGTLKYKRELFAKKYGHHEWVTSCCHLSDGKILSAGMDSQLCLWDARIVRCDHILGHKGSITKVLVDQNNIAISASYDATMIIWDMQTKSEATKLFGPHKDAILDFAWNNSLVVSGDKTGVVAIWDINEGTPIKFAKIHKGAVSQVMLYADGNNNNLIVTAGINDGQICVQDMRTNELVFTQQIHSGAINALGQNLSSFIITGSADKTIKLIDVIGGFKIFRTMKATDALYSIQPMHNLTLAGSGDGNVFCYDNDSGKCLYGFGAMSKGCVRQIQATDDCSKLIAVGDDFSPIVMKYQ